MKFKSGKTIFFLILGLFILSTAFVIAQENDSSVADTNTASEQEDNPEINQLNQKIEENKKKIENLKRATEEYSQKIEEYKSKSATFKNQLGLLDNQLVKIELDVRTAQLQIDKTKLEIDAMDYKINQNEKEMDALKSNLIEYIKLLNKSDQKSYLEILILNDSFAEFFNQISYLEGIQADIQQTVERLKLLKETVEVQKADKERQKTELEKSKDQLQAVKNKLQDDQNAKEVLLVETRSSEIQFQNLLLESKQQANEIDSEILKLQDQIKSKIEKLQKEGTTAADTLVNWPVPSHEITAYFHDPDYPFRYVYEHPAIDIRAKQGTEIKAPAEGYVARVNDGGYGYSYIILIHSNGLSTVYGHVSAIYVKEDTYVKPGDVIGLSGGLPGTRGAGRLTLGPHLHFEVRLNGIPVNPLEYLP